MRSRSVLSQVKSGLCLSAIVLLVGGWLVLVFGGMGVALTPSRYPPVVGWFCLAVAALIMVATMRHWVKAAPGLLALGAIRGFFMVILGGTSGYVGSPHLRFTGAVGVAFLLCGAIVIATFGGRRLRVLDRLALVAFAFCFFWQVADDRMAVISAAIGCSSLIGAWTYDHMQTRHSCSRRRQPAGRLN